MQTVTANQIERHKKYLEALSGGGEIIDIQIYEQAKGGGWSAVFKNELCARRVEYAHRNTPGVNFGESKNIGGWFVSIKPDTAKC